MSYQFARGMAVQKNSLIQIKQIKKQANLISLFSFIFKKSQFSIIQNSKIPRVFYQAFLLGCFHITFVISVIIILVDAHKIYKSVHCVTIIAQQTQQTWENFSFQRQKLMAREKNALNYSTQNSAFCLSQKLQRQSVV